MSLQKATLSSLAKKLVEIMAVVERIPKNGWNDFHKYAFATEADISDALRGELAARNVLLIPSIVAEARHPVGEKGSVLTVLDMEMEFLDAETMESIKKPWRGYGTDKEDKGGYKAMTGGEKYFLLKTFLIPTGDDPEAGEQEKRPNATSADRNRQQRPQPATATASQGRPADATTSAKPAATSARPPLPPGAVYLNGIQKKQVGKTRWVEVALSTGKTVVASDDAVIVLLNQLAEANVPVVLTTTPNPKADKPDILKQIAKWAPPASERAAS